MDTQLGLMVFGFAVTIVSVLCALRPLPLSHRYRI